MFLDVPFFKITASAITLKNIKSSLIIPANVTNLTVAKCMHCYFCFALQLPC